MPDRRIGPTDLGEIVRLLREAVADGEERHARLEQRVRRMEVTITTLTARLTALESPPETLFD